MTKKTKETLNPFLEKPTKIHAFQTVDANGDKFTHKNLMGHWSILYFYPKDMTSGCTTEAREFEVAQKRFAALNCKVVGVSKDTCALHLKFAQKENLSFALLSDKESDLCEKFEVWKEKSLYGRKYMGIERTTFIINPEGLIVARFSKVKVVGHVDEVLKSLSQYQKS
jgi:peroxiredoxin Q/BCP